MTNNYFRWYFKTENDVNYLFIEKVISGMRFTVTQIPVLDILIQLSALHYNGGVNKFKIKEKKENESCCGSKKM